MQSLLLVPLVLYFSCVDAFAYVFSVLGAVCFRFLFVPAA